jgi:hypothetical protein
MNQVGTIDNNLTVKDVFFKYPKIKDRRGYYKLKECVQQMFSCFMLQFVDGENWGNKELIVPAVLKAPAKSFIKYSHYEKENAEINEPDSNIVIHPSAKTAEILASKTKKIAYIDQSLFETLAMTKPPKEYVVNNFFYPELFLVFPVKNNRNILFAYFAVVNKTIQYYVYPHMGGDYKKQHYECGHISMGIPVDEKYPIDIFSDAFNQDSYERQITGSEGGSFWISNFLLWQQSMHDKGEEIILIDTPPQSKGFGKNSKQIIVPQVIGEGYKPKVIRDYNPIGTHASPRTHWRSGHWRQQPYGSREQPQYKTTWIEPVLVNG